MGWRHNLDTLIVPIRRKIAKAMAPDPSALGYPLFSARIRDRKRRWLVEQQPNPYTAVASKTGGQAFMQGLGHAVPQVYGVYPSLDALPGFDRLPRSFVLKPLRGWSAAGVFLLKDGFDLIRRRNFTREEVIQTARAFSGSARRSIAGEWVAEELLFDFADAGKPAPDYKFYCFGPKPVLIRISQWAGVADQTKLCWYQDPDGTRLRRRVHWNDCCELYNPPCPPYLAQMRDIVSDAGRHLNIFVRIDMYATQRGPVFGEFTAYPASGKRFTPWADAWLGSHWTTPDGGAPPEPTPASAR